VTLIVFFSLAHSIQAWRRRRLAELQSIICETLQKEIIDKLASLDWKKAFLPKKNTKFLLPHFSISLDVYHAVVSWCTENDEELLLLLLLLHRHDTTFVFHFRRLRNHFRRRSSSPFTESQKMKFLIHNWSPGPPELGFRDSPSLRERETEESTQRMRERAHGGRETWCHVRSISCSLVGLLLLVLLLSLLLSLLRTIATLNWAPSPCTGR
jgi:hypothetical protein